MSITDETLREESDGPRGVRLIRTVFRGEIGFAGEYVVMWWGGPPAGLGYGEETRRTKTMARLLYRRKCIEVFGHPPERW